MTTRREACTHRLAADIRTHLSDWDGNTHCGLWVHIGNHHGELPEALAASLTATGWRQTHPTLRDVI